MGSMGFLLADWAIELIRTRRRKEKELKRKRKHVSESNNQTEGTACKFCHEAGAKLKHAQTNLLREEQKMKRLSKILKEDDIESVVESVLKMTQEIDTLKSSMHELQEENNSLTGKINEEKYLLDIKQNEKIKSLEIQMAEKESQLLRTSNNVRGQLAIAKQEVSQLSKEVERFENYKNMSESGSWQQEAESLQLVLEMRKQELDKLKAANNSLLLELERLRAVELQLQVEKQKTEEMSAVIGQKNDQMHQVLDEYEALQHQLEIEVASHLACQQELEKVQWAHQSFMGEEGRGSKEWKDIQNRKQSSGHIQHVVHKEKGIAYSFNC